MKWQDELAKNNGEDKSTKPSQKEDIRYYRAPVDS